MFQVTPAAAQEILAAATRSDAAGMALRVAARLADDGSVEFGMGFDEQREDDEPMQVDDLTVLIGAPSRPLLDGAVLDYVELQPGQPEFVFIPAAASAPAPAPDAAPRGCGSGGCGPCSCG